MPGTPSETKYIPQNRAGPGLTRRRLALGSGIAAASLIRPAFAGSDSGKSKSSGAQGSLPVKRIEEIMQAKGKTSSGILEITIFREDLKSSLPGNIPVTPGGLLNGSFYFQSLGQGIAAMNGDFCLKTSETNRFIMALIENGLTVQAFHQHLAEISPLYWFIHMRGEGDPTKLATGLHNAIRTTSTPLPQPSPPESSPLDKGKLEKILGGSADIGSGGAIMVEVKRKEAFHLGGHKIKRGLGITAEIAFQPLDSSGSRALAIPDFAMIASEINPVLKTMHSQGFHIGCLYNQETDEHPQLYFSHQWSVGDPYDLARKIRNGLNHTDSLFEPS